VVRLERSPIELDSQSADGGCDKRTLPERRKRMGDGNKIGTGKLSVGQDLATFLLDQMTRNRIELLPISVGDAGRVAVLPFHHKDPFDRLIVAQSLAGQMPLVSRDEALDGYGITRLW
jgi:PIN domain nuclease of toxin-antitoxin system